MKGVSEGSEHTAFAMQDKRRQQAKRRPAAPLGLNENADGRSGVTGLHRPNGNGAETVQR